MGYTWYIYQLLVISYYIYIYIYRLLIIYIYLGVWKSALLFQYHYHSHKIDLEYLENNAYICDCEGD